MALGALAVVGFALPGVVQAAGCGLSSPEICIATIFVWIFQRLTALMGFILIMEVDALIRVAGYFNFVSPGPTAVRIGWVVTRDLANMFFIVFLMIIAFSTVIGYSKYHYEQTLKKLLIMAVIINFSKTIVGLMIDISQVVMLSFVNGFRAAAAGNFMNAFQINKLLALGDGPAEYNFGLVLAMMLAFILAAIAACVVLVMLVMLVFRVIMLWVLIILSPIAFLTAAFPLSGGYYAQWWGELKKYLIGGPVVAFFLWLALATAQQTAGNLSSPQEGWGVQSAASAQEVEGQATKSQIPSEAGRTDTILSMVIVCCIMFAGLKFAADPAISGLASGFAGKVKGKAVSALRAGTVGVAGYGLKRAAEPVMTTVGKGLARVPLVGAAGRYMALKGEGMKKARLAGREKMFGGAEDMARLSPGAFTRKLGGLKDPREIDKYMKIASANPDLMASLAPKESINPLTGKREIKGVGRDVMKQWASSDSPAAAKFMMGDARSKAWLKNDPELLKQTYDGLKDTAEKDPNRKKDLSEFEQKMAVPLQKNGMFGNIPSVVKEKLAGLVPKMSADDFKDVAGSDMGTFMEHMTGKQFREMAVDGKTDQQLGMSSELAKMPKDKALEFMRERGLNATEVPDSWYSNEHVADYVLASTSGKAEARGKIMADETRAKALQDAAKRGLSGPNAPTDDNKRAAAAVQAMSVGALKVSDLDVGDASGKTLRDVLSRSGDTAAIARNIDKDDPDQLAVGREIFKTIMGQDPTRARNLSKNDLYNKLLPSKAEIDAAVTAAAAAQAAGVAQVKTTEREVERRGLAGDAVNVKADLSGQLKALQDAIHEDRLAGRPTATKEQQADQVAKAMQDLTRATEQRANAEQELAQEMQRLSVASSTGGDAAAIQSAVDRLKKGIQDLDSTLAKQVATIKGIKFDEGGGGGRKNRGGGGGRV
ncbi:MAG: hypothetical protein WC866_06315 [Patescibacteria group bacterium]